MGVDLESAFADKSLQPASVNTEKVATDADAQQDAQQDAQSKHQFDAPNKITELLIDEVISEFVYDV